MKLTGGVVLCMDIKIEMESYYYYLSLNCFDRYEFGEGMA